MTANMTSFHQNFMPEKKSGDAVEKDVRKWVESVCEFKANIEKQKNEPSLEKQKNETPLEKHLKKAKKFKIKRKNSCLKITVGAAKNIDVQRKSHKAKKLIKRVGQTNTIKEQKNELVQNVNGFEQMKDSYMHVKLPQNWTSGVSNGRIVFNRIKMSTNNYQQKMNVERTLVITKDCNVHILLNGSEIKLNNWETQKVNTLDDIKKVIKDIDSMKICDGPTGGSKSPQCSVLMDKKLKSCQACTSEITNPEKLVVKKPRIKKKPGAKEVTKQKSIQK